MIKMIVTDLDGTILNRERFLTTKTEEYLKKLKHGGFIVVIATGRTYASALKVTRGAEFANYIISDAGSCTFVPSKDIPVFQNTLDKKTISHILDYWDESFEYIDVCDRDSYIKYTHHINKEDFLKDVQYATHMSIKTNSNEYTEKLYEKLKKELPDVSLLLMQDSFKPDKAIEIAPLGTSKYSAIKKLADMLNIDKQEILAIGDSQNDLDMIKNCGFGVAMKNALKEIKDIAEATTKKDYNEDGAIEFLQEILGETE